MAGFVLGIKGTKLNCKNFVLEAVCGKGLGGRGQRYILEIFFFFFAWSYLLCYIHLYTRKRKILLTNFNFCSIDSAIQTSFPFFINFFLKWEEAVKRKE